MAGLLAPCSAMEKLTREGREEEGEGRGARGAKAGRRKGGRGVARGARTPTGLRSSGCCLGAMCRKKEGEEKRRGRKENEERKGKK
jgi:hypothetical protein